MANSNSQIYMDYQGMCQKAQELEELADKLEALAENKVACYAANKSFWQGDSGDACRQKLTKLDSVMRSRAKSIRNTASGLRKAAERQYRMEKTLSAIISR
ncbi:MAG: WXG100 family type VII secretion target [Lachnospiraceae bacterium]|nr:WXG100 family type VII secretion target [Lachnospiraceae bacterium]